MIHEPRVITNGLMSPCCAEEKNLGVVQNFNDEITYRRCKVCDRRHFAANSEPGKLFTQGYAIR